MLFTDFLCYTFNTDFKPEMCSLFLSKIRRNSNSNQTACNIGNPERITIIRSIDREEMEKNSIYLFWQSKNGRSPINQYG